MASVIHNTDFSYSKLISNLSYFARIDYGWIQVFASNILLYCKLHFFIPDVRFNDSGMDKVYLSLVFCFVPSDLVDF